MLFYVRNVFTEIKLAFGDTLVTSYVAVSFSKEDFSFVLCPVLS